MLRSVIPALRHCHFSKSAAEELLAVLSARAAKAQPRLEQRIQPSQKLTKVDPVPEPLHLASWETLFSAVKTGNLDELNKLAQYPKCNLSQRGPGGATLLHIAAWHGHLNVCEWLMERGVELTATNDYGETAQDYAAAAEQLTVLTSLQQHRLHK